MTELHVTLQLNSKRCIPYDRKLKKHHDNVLIIRIRFINAVCWDLRVKVF